MVKQMSLVYIFLSVLSFMYRTLKLSTSLMKIVKIEKKKRFVAIAGLIAGGESSTSGLSVH